MEHLNTNIGVIVHLHVSFQEADFTVDTFYYNAMDSSLKCK